MTEYEKGFHDGFEKAKSALSSKISTCINNCELMPTPKELEHKCCICGRQFSGDGNNPAPVEHANDDVCCDACNTDVVIPLRLFLHRMR